MSYHSRRYKSYRSKPQVRTITVKFAGKCACCGATIPAGAIADYYPVGTIAGVQTSQIAHVNGLDGNSKACFAELQKRAPIAPAVDSFDMRYEDDCARATGCDHE